MIFLKNAILGFTFAGEMSLFGEIQLAKAVFGELL